MNTTLLRSAGSTLIPPFPKATVADVMRPDILGCAAEAPLMEVADTITSHPIVIRDGRPAGVVSGLDVAAAIAWGGGG